MKQKAHSVFNSETLKYLADCLNERSTLRWTQYKYKVEWYLN